MGLVYRARHRAEQVALRQGGDVAIKVMHAHYARNDAFRERFEREASLGLSLQHSGIVAVHDLVVDGETLGLVMELIEGRPLATMIGEETGPIPWARAAPMIAQLLDAVEAAHEGGVIHRDLKPENVLVTPQGQLKILDFGIAKAADSTQTKTGTGMGTVAYMAPEQFQDSKSVDARADVYALGMTLFEMLAGRLPWDVGASEFTIMTRKVEDSLPPPTDFYPDIPPPVVEALQQATAADAEQRLESIAAFRAALPAAELALPASAPPAPSSSPAATAEAPSPAPAPPVPPAAEPPSPVAPRASRPPEASGPADEAASSGGSGKMLGILGLIGCMVLGLGGAGLGAIVLLNMRSIEAEAERQTEALHRERAQQQQEIAGLQTGRGWTEEEEQEAAEKGYQPDMAAELGIEFVRFEGSSEGFTMGSSDGQGEPDEGPVRVTLSPFEISATEITQDQWRAVMGTDPIATRSRRWGGKDGALCRDHGVGGTLPMHCISWWEATQFTNALSGKDGLVPYYGYPDDGGIFRDDEAVGSYRLPTEAEWEFASLGGDGRGHRFSGTNQEASACRFGNVGDRSARDTHSWISWGLFPCNDGFHTLAPVASFRAVAGLYDMTGNVWEWVENAYSPEHSPGDDPHGPYWVGETDEDGHRWTHNQRMVIRGASWHNKPADTRVKNRYFGGAEEYSYYVGFRIVRDAR